MQNDARKMVAIPSRVVYIVAPGEVLGNEQATPSPLHDTIRKRT